MILIMSAISRSSCHCMDKESYSREGKFLSMPSIFLLGRWTQQIACLDRCSHRHSCRDSIRHRMKRWNVDRQLSFVREGEDGMILDLCLPKKNNLATDIRVSPPRSLRPFMTLYGRNIHLLYTVGFYHAPQPMGLDATQK